METEIKASEAIVGEVYVSPTGKRMRMLSVNPNGRVNFVLLYANAEIDVSADTMITKFDGDLTKVSDKDLILNTEKENQAMARNHELEEEETDNFPEDEAEPVGAEESEEEESEEEESEEEEEEESEEEESEEPSSTPVKKVAKPIVVRQPVVTPPKKAVVKKKVARKSGDAEKLSRGAMIDTLLHDGIMDPQQLYVTLHAKYLKVKKVDLMNQIYVNKSRYVKAHSKKKGKK